MPDPNPAKTIVRLAAKFIEVQAKRVVGNEFAIEAGKALAEYAGADTLDALTNFFGQAERAEKILAAFKRASRTCTRS